MFKRNSKYEIHAYWQHLQQAASAELTQICLENELCVPSSGQGQLTSLNLGLLSAQ